MITSGEIFQHICGGAKPPLSLILLSKMVSLNAYHNFIKYWTTFKIPSPSDSTFVTVIKDPSHVQRVATRAETSGCLGRLNTAKFKANISQASFLLCISVTVGSDSALNNWPHNTRCGTWTAPTVAPRQCRDFDKKCFQETASTGLKMHLNICWLCHGPHWSRLQRSPYQQLADRSSVFFSQVFYFSFRLVD